MSDVPTIEEELERKALETLRETLQSFQRGTRSRESASAALQALWGAVAGLVSRDLMASIGDSRDHIDAQPADPPRMLLYPHGDAMLALTAPEPAFPHVWLVKPGKLSRLNLPDETLDELQLRFRAAARNCEAKLGPQIDISTEEDDT